MKRNSVSSSSGQVNSRRTVEQTHRLANAIMGTAVADSNKRRRLQGEAVVAAKRRDSKTMGVAAAADADFPKLDQSNPDHARRIQQRRRMVAFGKNTVGYDEYMKQVPKEKRRPRCMKHPSTPDHTLDIPTKRWQGLVRAWRRALHQYDPPDMLKALNDEASNMDVDNCNIVEKSTVKRRLFVDAGENKGLLGATPESKKAGSSLKISSPSSLATVSSFIACSECASVTQNDTDELDMWEQGRPDEGHLWEDIDSDDDLL